MKSETIGCTLPNGVTVTVKVQRGERWVSWMGRKDKHGFVIAHASENDARDFLRTHSSHGWVGLWPIRYIAPAEPAGRPREEAQPS